MRKIDRRKQIVENCYNALLCLISSFSEMEFKDPLFDFLLMKLITTYFKVLQAIPLLNLKSYLRWPPSENIWLSL